LREGGREGDVRDVGLGEGVGEGGGAVDGRAEEEETGVLGERSDELACVFDREGGRGVEREGG